MPASPAREAFPSSFGWVSAPLYAQTDGGHLEAVQKQLLEVFERSQDPAHPWTTQERSFVEEDLLPWLARLKPAYPEPKEQYRALASRLWRLNLLHDRIFLEEGFGKPFVVQLSRFLRTLQASRYPVSNEAIRFLTTPTLPDLGEEAQAPPFLRDLALGRGDFPSFVHADIRSRVDYLSVDENQLDRLIGVNPTTLNRTQLLEQGVFLGRLARAVKRGTFVAKGYSSIDLSQEIGKKIVGVIQTWTDVVLREKTPIEKVEALRLVYMLQSVCDSENCSEDIREALKKPEVRALRSEEVAKIYEKYLSHLPETFLNDITAPVVYAADINRERERKEREERLKILKDLASPLLRSRQLWPLVRRLPGPDLSPMLLETLTKDLTALLAPLVPPSDLKKKFSRDNLLDYAHFHAFRYSFPSHWIAVLKRHGYRIDGETIHVAQVFQEQERSKLESIMERWFLIHAPLTARLAQAAVIDKKEIDLGKVWSEGKTDPALEKEIETDKNKYLESVSNVYASYPAALKADRAEATLFPALIRKGLPPDVILAVTRHAEASALLPHQAIATATLFTQKEIEEELGGMGSGEWDQAAWVGIRAYQQAMNSPAMRQLKKQFPEVARQQELRLCDTLLRLHEKRNTLKKLSLPLQRPGFDWETAVVGIRLTEELLNHLRVREQALIRE